MKRKLLMDLQLHISFRPPWLQFPYYNHAKRYTLINVSSSLRRFFFSRKQVVCTLDVHMVRKRALKTTPWVSWKQVIGSEITILTIRFISEWIFASRLHSVCVRHPTPSSPLLLLLDWRWSHEQSHVTSFIAFTSFIRYFDFKKRMGKSLGGVISKYTTYLKLLEMQ